MRFTHIMVPIIATSIFTLTGCANSAEAPTRSERANRSLERTLGDRTAGTPQRCISTRQARNMSRIDADTILFRESGRRIWRTEMSGNCGGIGSGRALVTSRSSGQFCRGDSAGVVDVRTRMMVGSCTFGEFVPYTRPAKN